jgi:hypothetical protein
VSVRGKKRGPNRAEGMATREAAPSCDTSLPLGTVVLRCFRRAGHRGPHWDGTIGQRVAWRPLPSRRSA